MPSRRREMYSHQTYVRVVGHFEFWVPRIFRLVYCRLTSKYTSKYNVYEQQAKFFRRPYCSDMDIIATNISPQIELGG